ncbi:MAG: hypothetical protein AB2693_11705 [Candidatus Thiodiazotropha sp.]
MADALHALNDQNFPVALEILCYGSTYVYNPAFMAMKVEWFAHLHGNRRYKYIVLGYQDTYFVKDHSDVHTKYSLADVIKMLKFLIDNV